MPLSRSDVAQEFISGRGGADSLPEDATSNEADLVTLLGNTDTVLHQQAAQILKEVVNESKTLSDETTLLIVALLNNPSEDISGNTRDLLFALSHYGTSLSLLWQVKLTDNIQGTIQKHLTHHNTIRKLLDFMGSNLIHVQCSVMAIFAVLVHESKPTLPDAHF